MHRKLGHMTERGVTYPPTRWKVKSMKVMQVINGPLANLWAPRL
jgi:hypothetical protein